MIQSKFYFKISGEWVYQGVTTDTEWSVSSLALQYAHAYQWRVDTYDTEIGLTTEGDEWSFATRNYPTVYDYERPDDYDDGLVWGWDGVEYRWLDPTEMPDITAAGGGRYNQQLVVVGHGCVYYGSL